MKLAHLLREESFIGFLRGDLGRGDLSVGPHLGAGKGARILRRVSAYLGWENGESKRGPRRTVDLGVRYVYIRFGMVLHYKTFSNGLYVQVMRM